MPFRYFPKVLMTRKWNPLSPKTLEYKFYARGVGPVLAVSVSGAATVRTGELPARPLTVCAGAGYNPSMQNTRFELRPVGVVESSLTDPATAPKQGREGGPHAWLVFEPGVLAARDGLRPSDRVLVLTWLDRAPGCAEGPSTG